MKHRAITAIDFLISVADTLTALIFIAIFFMQVVGLAFREFLGIGFTEQTEIGAFAVVIFCFVGMARGFSNDEHVRFDALHRKMPPNIGRALVLVSYVLTIVALCVLLYFGAKDTFQYSKLYLRAVSMEWLPLWPLMAVIPLGALLSVMALFVVVQRQIKAWRQT